MPSDGKPASDPQLAQLYDEHYFRHYRGAPYERSELWLQMFAALAEGIIGELKPETVLDVGCAMGFLVEALRQRGVEAFGLDISEYAIDHIRDDIRPFCSVASIVDPIDGRYDLIVCHEVLEHLPAHDAERAISNLCRATDDVLFSSTPDGYAEDTHLNVRPTDYWASLFANSGFVHDVDANLAGFAPWAMRFRKQSEPWPRVVASYERHVWLVSQENRALRARALETVGQAARYERRLQEETTHQSEVDALRRTVADQTEHLAALGERVEFLTDTQAELRRMLMDAHEQLVLRDQELQAPLATVEALRQQTALVERQTAWAHQLNGEVAIRDGIVQELQAKLAEQAAWAQQLNNEVAIRDGIVHELQAKLSEQAAWAQRLNENVATRDGMIRELQSALAEHATSGERLNAEVASRDTIISQLRAASAQPRVGGYGLAERFGRWLGRRRA